MISAEKTETSIGLDEVDQVFVLLRRQSHNSQAPRNDVEKGEYLCCPLIGCPMRTSLHHEQTINGIAVGMGNEVTGVEQTTLEISDYVVHIPMI